MWLGELDFYLVLIGDGNGFFGWVCIGGDLIMNRSFFYLICVIWFCMLLMLVPLGAASGAFEGEYASTFAIELGSHIRRLVPLNKETWAAIDDGCKEAIFTAAAVIKQYFTS